MNNTGLEDSSSPATTEYKVFHEALDFKMKLEGLSDAQLRRRILALHGMLRRRLLSESGEKEARGALEQLTRYALERGMALDGR